MISGGFLDTFLAPMIGNPPAQRDLFAESVQLYPPGPRVRNRINPGMYLYVECCQKTEEKNA
jgi:hypothetical protein